MRKRIFAILTAASMFICATPAYVRACDTPPNAQGSYDTGLEHKNAQALNHQSVNNGQATDKQMDAISRVDTDNDTARDSHSTESSVWLKGGSWSAPTTTTTATTLPVRPGF